MNENILLVMEWLEDRNSVSSERLRANGRDAHDKLAAHPLHKPSLPIEDDSVPDDYRHLYLANRVTSAAKDDDYEGPSMETSYNLIEYFKYSKENKQDYLDQLSENQKGNKLLEFLQKSLVVEKDESGNYLIREASCSFGFLDEGIGHKYRAIVWMDGDVVHFEGNFTHNNPTK